MTVRPAARIFATGSLLALAAPASAPAQSVGPAPATPPFRLDAIYKADLLRAARANDAGLDLLDLSLTVDAGAWLGWSGTTLRFEALSTHGSKPNRRLGTLGGISNLEVEQNSVRPYATWVTRDLAPRLNLLAGLYDLNSEFYSTDASALLIHPAFGIGTEFAQSGRNGPSIFPNLGLALRLRAHAENGFYAQGALLDGLPGDPASPGRTSLHVEAHDGALLVGEAGWNDGAGGHAAAGTWRYTRASPQLGSARNEANHGAYALAQAVVRRGPIVRTTGFVRLGLADPRVNAVDAAGEAGVLLERPLGAGGPAAFTAGATIAHASAARRRLDAQNGAAARPAELALEAGVRWRLGSHWSLQPLVQQLWNPGARAGHATVAGLHLEGALQPASP